jgi:hypothetical protein
MLYTGILTTFLAGIKKKASHIDIERLSDPPRKGGGVYLFRSSSVTTLVRRGDQRKGQGVGLESCGSFREWAKLYSRWKGGVITKDREDAPRCTACDLNMKEQWDCSINLEKPRTWDEGSL